MSAREHPRWSIAAAPPASSRPPLFPPALVPLVRERIHEGPLLNMRDDVLDQLLTVVFFAGLETNEGERHPIRVVFLGEHAPDVILADDEQGDVGTYRWKQMRFETPRPFTVPELVKLSLVTTDEKLYCAVHLSGDVLAIAGLAREGLHLGDDVHFKILASRPGRLTIRSGRERVLEYDRGELVAFGEHVVFAAGPVRDALQTSAEACGVSCNRTEYLDAVRALVREMAAHGRGGILIIHSEDRPLVPPTAAYRMVLDGSVASMLGIAKLIERSDHVPTSSERRKSFGNVLRGAFLAEAERRIEEIGAMTAIDGATVLNRALSVVAFGLVLPVVHDVRVYAAAGDEDSLKLSPVDFGSRGTRHRAAATYAAQHPGSTVFVASADGDVSCMLRPGRGQRTRMFRLGPRDAV